MEDYKIIWTNFLLDKLFFDWSEINEYSQASVSALLAAPAEHKCINSLIELIVRVGSSKEEELDKGHP